MSFKALTAYPVFVLTLVSLLAISYLAIQVLNETNNSIHRVNSLLNNNELTNNDIEYVLINNSLYVKCSCNSLYEIMVYRNNTYSSIKLYKNNYLCGPIVFNENTSYILLIERASGSHILDILYIDKTLDNITLDIKNYYPPSLYIAGDKVNIMSSLNSFYHFYVLDPINITSEEIVENGRIYTYYSIEPSIDQLSGEGITVFNNTVNSSLDLDNRFRKLLTIYGRVREDLTYHLNLYLYKSYRLEPLYLYFTRVSLSKTITVSREIPLLSDSYENEVSLNICISGEKPRIVVRDIYGNTYDTDVRVEYWLIIKNETQIQRILLDGTSYSGRDDVFNLSKQLYLYPGEYSVYLDIYYYVVVVDPVYSFPLYVSINQYIWGGWSNYCVGRTYLYDELTVVLDNYTFIYRPFYNNTVVNISRESIVYDNETYIGINGTYFDTNTVSILYCGEDDVYVVDTVYPKTIVKIKPYILINGIDENTLIYLINKTGRENVYGLYYPSNRTSIELVFLPVITCNETYIVFDEEKPVYLLDRGASAILVYDDKHYLLNSDYDVHGLYVIERYSYEYPILMLNHNSVLNETIEVHYVNGSKTLYRGFSRNTFILNNTIVERIVITYGSSTNGYVIYSLNGKYIGYIDPSRGIIDTVSSSEKLFGETLVLETSRGYALLINNSFTMLGSS